MYRAPIQLVKASPQIQPSAQVVAAFPHEGGVGVPEGETHARVIATGMSTVTSRPFNLIVAFESMSDAHGNKLGRAIANRASIIFVITTGTRRKGVLVSLKNLQAIKSRSSRRKWQVSKLTSGTPLCGWRLELAL